MRYFLTKENANSSGNINVGGNFIEINNKEVRHRTGVIGKTTSLGWNRERHFVRIGMMTVTKNYNNCVFTLCINVVVFNNSTIQKYKIF